MCDVHRPLESRQQQAGIYYDAGGIFILHIYKQDEENCGVLQQHDTSRNYFLIRFILGILTLSHYPQKTNTIQYCAEKTWYTCVTGRYFILGPGRRHLLGRHLEDEERKLRIGSELRY